MLGVRRPPPPFSLDDLELERSAIASKIQNNRTLSIYEATLEKLRSGSRRAFKKIEGPKERPSETQCSGKPMEIDQEASLEKLRSGSLHAFMKIESPKEDASETDTTEKQMNIDEGAPLEKLRSGSHCTIKKIEGPTEDLPETDASEKLMEVDESSKVIDSLQKDMIDCTQK